jgi:hypothetical protein
MCVYITIFFFYDYYALALPFTRTFAVDDVAFFVCKHAKIIYTPRCECVWEKNEILQACCATTTSTTF